MAVLTVAHKLLRFIRQHQLLKAGNRLAVAVSGGADSVALLRLLLELRAELGTVLSVVHFNHKLRGHESDGDEGFVAEIARTHGLEFRRGEGDVRACCDAGLSLEAAARKLRYEFFARLLRDQPLDRIATAHTLDDQAETVLLRLARGAGTRGLAGIYPRVTEAASAKTQIPRFARDDIGSGEGSGGTSGSGGGDDVLRRSIIRPLLAVRRAELVAYLEEIGQAWREDSSNRSRDHARNRVRQELLPWLEINLNPSVREQLAESAEIAREEEEYWQGEIAAVSLRCWNMDTRCLRLAELAKMSSALRRRVVRSVSESFGLRLDFRHVEQVLEVCSGEAKSVVLPAGWKASRESGTLKFGLATEPEIEDYQYELRVPGRVNVREAGAVFETMVAEIFRGGYDAENLLEPRLQGARLVVRNWRAGDRFWASHGKGPRKIKELLQRRHVTGTCRKLWPVIGSGEEVVWMRGFGAAQNWRPQENAGKAVVIRMDEFGQNEI